MNIIILSAFLLLLIGFLSLIFGLVVLVRKALSREVEEVTEEAAKLAKKGLLTDMGSSLQSASFLVKEMRGVLLITFLAE